MSTFNFKEVELDRTAAGGGASELPHHDAADLNGTATIEHADCHVKRFLHAIELQGMKVCKDLEIDAGGELLIKGGTGEDFKGADLIRKMEMVFGTYDSATHSFTAANPADRFVEGVGSSYESVNTADPDLGDSTYDAETLVDSSGVGAVVTSTDKWYIKIIKADLSVTYEEFVAINDLLDNAGGSHNVSILASMESVRTLQEALEAAIEAKLVLRKDYVDNLETKVQSDFDMLAQFLNFTEDSLQAMIDANDKEVQDYMEDRIHDLEISFENAMNRVRLHGESSVGLSQSCGMDTTFEAVVDSAFVDVEKWMLDIGVFNNAPGDEQRRGDVDVQWEAKIVLDGADHKLQVTASIEACDDSLGENLLYIVNGIWCGDQPTVDENPLLVADPTISNTISHELRLNEEGEDDAQDGETKIDGDNSTLTVLP